MKKKDRNLLDLVPVANPCIQVVQGEDGTVHLDIWHKGWADKVAQKCFKKPPVTHVALEEFGSFIWPRIDGSRSVYEIALLVREAFGPEAEPLFDRLAEYFSLLKKGGYIDWK